MKKTSIFMENLPKQSTILDLSFGILDSQMLTPSGFNSVTSQQKIEDALPQLQQVNLAVKIGNAP
jgi:hypothetical protein